MRNAGQADGVGRGRGARHRGRDRLHRRGLGASCELRVWGVVHPQLYTLHPTPYTQQPDIEDAIGYTAEDLVTPAPCTLNSTPYTLPYTPYTLHSTLYTLHPKLYTLRRTPYTLHPTPFTLQPTPDWLHRRCLGAPPSNPKPWIMNPKP